MGWSQGSELLGEIIQAREVYLPESSSKKDIEFYLKLIDVFEDMDADTLDELKGVDENFDKALMVVRVRDTLQNQLDDSWISIEDLKSVMELNDTDIQFLKECGEFSHNHFNIWIDN